MIRDPLNGEVVPEDKITPGDGRFTSPVSGRECVLHIYRKKKGHAGKKQ